MLRLRFLLSKTAQALATLFAVVTFNFLLFRVLPGDPIRLMSRAGHLQPEDIARIRSLFGLDQPLWDQYLIYLRNLATGQLGISLTYREPVTQILAERIINTVLLLTAATVIVVVIGIAVGVIAGARPGSRFDTGAVATTLIFWSLPTFWTGLMLIMILGVYFGVFPISNMETIGGTYATPFDHAIDVGSHLVLPTLTLALVDVGQFVLITRSALVDVMTEDFILTAKAKGLSRAAVVWKHGVRNALLPVVTTSALYVGLVMGGAIQVETVFSWPGLGRLVYDAVLRRDYPLLEASFLVFAVTVILANYLADITYMLLDPRVRNA
jgi:peptide/nickel transport system permease protein